MDYQDVHVPTLEGGNIPFEDCTMENGKKGVRYGASGKCYATREEAAAQAAAIHASGWAEKGIKKFGLMSETVMDEENFDSNIAHSRLVDETQGAAEYNRAAEAAKDPELKKLLSSLGAEELEHGRKLMAWVEAHPPKVEAEKSAPHSEADEPFDKSIMVDIAKAEGNVVYGVVLHANVPDLQGDIMSPEDIKKAMHNFMENYRTINKDHMTDIDACPVECWQAEKAGILGKSTYGAGDWLMGTKINDPVMWQDVLTGKYKSYSIEGRGTRLPLA